MNAKTALSLMVALILGLAATWVGRNLVLANRSAGPASSATTRVVVAKVNLEPGELIGANDLTLTDLPTSTVSKAMFTDPKALVGRAVVSPIVKGQAMFAGLLAPAGAEGGLQALVPSGMRAVSVDVNESSAVAGLLMPGCRVDVIATLRSDDGGQMARTIVENVKVQAVNRKLSRERADEPTAGAIKTVTLIVSPKDAEAVELASTSGRLRLVLRGTADNAPTQSPGITYSELTGLVNTVDGYFETSPQPTSAGRGGPMERFLSALMRRPGEAPADEEGAAMQTSGMMPAAPAGPMRRAVRVIRGNSESTIFYEMRPGRPAPRGPSEPDWSVTTEGQTPPEPADPFSTTK